MTCRLFIENPPPFKQAHRGKDGTLVDVALAEGVTAAQLYLGAGLSLAGLHHSDLDRYESRRIRGEGMPDRHDSFAYVHALKERVGPIEGLLIPHRVTVYRTVKDQTDDFRKLVQAGIGDIVLVGRPYSVPPAGTVYQSTVEEGLAFLSRHLADLGFNLGVIGIHTRAGEVDRIVRKFEAAGGRLRVMGQFLDDIDALTSFMDRLVQVFESRRLDLGRIEWNVGLAIFALKTRTFYAKLLRQDRLACEDRFVDLKSMEMRIAASIDMNVEFAYRAKEYGLHRGIDIGFSIQPLIERDPSGAIHPAVHGAISMARRLQRDLA